jgi:beta-mannanase
MNEGWAGMSGAGGSLSWLTTPWHNSGYTLSLGVPMIPTDSSGTPVGTLATGATGAYNANFVTLAQNLVAAGEGNSYLRIGWEFDGSWYPWSATTPATEASFAAYFAQIVTAMRSVPGQSFRFVWNPDAAAFTQSGYNVELAYPGSAYVSAIGLDAYDQSWVSPQTPTTAWNGYVLPGLEAAAAFASAQGKPLAITEWGVAIRTDGHGLGDDPLYVDNFTAWMKNPANDVVYESYFDFNADGTNSLITGGSFPNALAHFDADLG